MNADAVLLGLMKANIAASLLIGSIFVLRKPVRALFGARVSYGLWVLPPLGALASLLPARIGPATIEHALTPSLAVASTPFAPQALAQGSRLTPLDPTGLALSLWLAGAGLCLGWFAFRQMRFAAAARLGRAGPAVVGVIRPLIVLPADFDTRYDETERALMRLHERTHLIRQDSRTAALAVLLRCLNWFNPVVHLAVRQMRIDQELACDAEVVAALPGIKRAYAETMLKSQLTAGPVLPLGCAWPTGSRHPLAERIDLLTAAKPSRAKRRAGAVLVAGLAVTASAGAWAALPARPGAVIVQAAPMAQPAVVRHVRHRPATHARLQSSVAQQDEVEPVTLVDSAEANLTLTPVAFISGAAAAPAPAPAPDANADPAPMVEEADWVHKPTSHEVANYFPVRASLENRMGKAMLRCIVRTSGKVSDCSVLSLEGVSEFGSAALRMSRLFVLRPRMVDGVPTDSPVRIPVVFAMRGCTTMLCVPAHYGR